MERWVGKVAVITGASAGIGASLAEKLVEEGLQVVGLARRKERIEELAQKLSGLKGKLYAFEVDITNEDNIVRAFKEIGETIGPVHVLVNNAGVAKKNSIIDGNTELWKQVLDTNVLGLTIATREAIKSMMTNHVDGHIINVNSVAGHRVPPVPNQNVYPASKHAVTGLTETLRYDLQMMKSKIKTTSLSPGFVSTEIIEAGGFFEDPAMVKLIAQVPALKPIDVTNAVLYVLSTPPNVQITELTIKPMGEMI
ncbi:unnamed protein product [Brassicogethes aeneus]|uniref:Farnesol dehydrogenase-like n=1 Tax=Brassicogethes aeneus TaxID=1431903 RepID=A0A9P0AV42_BRAAE|nr:unnamed protein product [Brassicogethes aeneus]